MWETRTIVSPCGFQVTCDDLRDKMSLLINELLMFGFACVNLSDEICNLKDWKPILKLLQSPLLTLGSTVAGKLLSDNLTVNVLFYM